jgi:hypothetical protein
MDVATTSAVGESVAVGTGISVAVAVTAWVGVVVTVDMVTAVDVKVGNGVRRAVGVAVLGDVSAALTGSSPWRSKVVHSPNPTRASAKSAISIPNANGKREERCLFITSIIPQAGRRVNRARYGADES